MIALSARTAWCARCSDATECDERGCITCAVLREKYQHEISRNSAVHAERMRRRRSDLAAAGKCINGAKHPAPEPGKHKCARCIEVHRKSSGGRLS